MRPRNDLAAYSFLPTHLNRKLAWARDVGCCTRGDIVEKGGFLTKRGSRVKNWKRRWFVCVCVCVCVYVCVSTHLISIRVVYLSLSFFLSRFLLSLGHSTILSVSVCSLSLSLPPSLSSGLSCRFLLVFSFPVLCVNACLFSALFVIARAVSLSLSLSLSNRFVLNTHSISYNKSPRDSGSLGVIQLETIMSLASDHILVKEGTHSTLRPCIQITTFRVGSLCVFLCFCSGSCGICGVWVLFLLRYRVFLLIFLLFFFSFRDPC
jgi:hypothetical protein